MVQSSALMAVTNNPQIAPLLTKIRLAVLWAGKECRASSRKDLACMETLGIGLLCFRELNLVTTFSC